MMFRLLALFSLAVAGSNASLLRGESGWFQVRFARPGGLPQREPQRGPAGGKPGDQAGRAVGVRSPCRRPLNVSPKIRNPKSGNPAPLAIHQQGDQQDQDRHDAGTRRGPEPDRRTPAVCAVGLDLVFAVSGLRGRSRAMAGEWSAWITIPAMGESWIALATGSPRLAAILESDLPPTKSRSAAGPWALDGRGLIQLG